jgi:hypothetical protein
MGIVTGFNLFPVVVPEPTSLQFWWAVLLTGGFLPTEPRDSAVASD